MTIVGSGAKFRGMERDVELYFDRDAFQKHVCGLVLHPLKGINLALHLYGPINILFLLKMTIRLITSIHNHLTPESLKSICLVRISFKALYLKKSDELTTH